ncbi:MULTISPECIES: hypothetical protein [Streptomyces]|uniref:Uncharacterized protein n=1 Tax=Streptomyces liliifuscus TaxID=2797636 RepID=A0A7T7RGG5_9ACTN|nr:hypothetical protein [Streptomyces liliifuscus]QQM45735.1 hypothetical protein JEQ17_44245 [Streptomyces liliifuscus]
MSDESAVRRAATEILGELPRLLGEGRAAAVAERVREALAQEPEDSTFRIEAVLREHPETRAWMRERLLPVLGERPAFRDYQELPGRSTVPAGEVFACPLCGSRWVRPTLDDRVPPCPEHRMPRVRQGG